MPDLQLRLIELPEPPTDLVRVTYSKVLGQFVLMSSDWSRIYTSPNLTGFQPVAGEYHGLMGVAGDLTPEYGLLIHSPETPFLLSACKG